MTINIKSYLAIFVCIIFLSSCQKEVVSITIEPPEFKGNDLVVNSISTNQPFAEIELGKFTVTLEKTKLQDVIDVIGSGVINHKGDAGNSLHWLCYSTPSQIIWLGSSEMGSSENIIDIVQAKATKSARGNNEQCPQLPAKFLPISTSFGWVGSKLTETEAILGKHKHHADILNYSYEGKKKGNYQNKEVEFDITFYMTHKIKDKKINELVMSHTTTY